VGPFLIALAIFATVTTAELPDRVLSEFALEILKQAGPVEDMEVAAFIVRADNGTLSLRSWPNQRRFRNAQWSGPLPPGVIAVIHSHPAMKPLPSGTDRREAMRLQIPIFAVSRGSLCKAGVRGEVRCAQSVSWLTRSGTATLEWRD
jgi:Prokaryotic homologs of the JAB domain